ncbi:sugar porter family MFS transporter Ecym_8060 [Eremothecium cymbalariae DBVPG|uniref:Major facilitator superfamily (MFS) profile domain-containing protein n=1 Tax=Eremothecium cymbalariae (strain CBS 270.75 / DBVPG 7215 / KCTC 17166 / NRRL Y-17582) TaxID=931890 RepID=G8JWY2_ERECY|nr:Hypothetical protein Ecym_8060 [Eremothecium cymbalariae DBVPG\
MVERNHATKHRLISWMPLSFGKVPFLRKILRGLSLAHQVSPVEEDTISDQAYRVDTDIKSSIQGGCTISEGEAVLDSSHIKNHNDVEDLHSVDNPNVLTVHSNRMSFVVGIFVATGGFLYGYDTGLINSITEMDYVKTHFSTHAGQFTAREMSILVSFLSLGTFFGALGAPLLADTYGRKSTIIFSTFFVFTVGTALQVAAHELKLLVIGRVCSGVAVGLISAAVPLYQGETVCKWLRGGIICTYQWAITWGLLLSSAVSQGTHFRNDSSSYRIPIALQFVWCFFLGTGMLLLPESPRYYVLKDQLDKAAKSLAFLRSVPEDDPGLLEELVEIKANYDYEMSLGSFSYLDCFKTSKSRSKQQLRMLTGILIQAFQQLSGINFIFYYGVNFFSRTGIGKSYLVSFVTYAVNVAFNVPGLFLVEYVGRRKLLLFGGVSMAISNFIIAIVGCSTNSVVANKVMVVFVCFFIASFSATWGGVVWVISAEMYPLGVRSKCAAICAASNWLVNFVCALITPYLIDTGSHTSTLGTKIFFIWGSLNAIGVLVVYLTVYETSGLTLEEIDDLYRLCPNSFSSYTWNSEIKVSPSQYRLSKSSAGITTKHSITQSTSQCTVQYLTGRNITASGDRYQSSSADTKFDGSVSSSALQAYMDLGNGLGLATYHRSPPSVVTEFSEDEQDSDMNHMTGLHRGTDPASQSINAYMSQLVNKSAC